MRILILLIFLALVGLWAFFGPGSAKSPDAPLLRSQTVQEALDPDRIIHWTNEFRLSQGLAPLRPNERLMLAARLRAEDMAAKGYFAHTSPSGEGPSEAAEQAGYSYMNISENIAMGNFRDNRELVQGWIDSPEHRENMADARMEDIGVAVTRDDSNRQFSGPMVISVQIFGRDDTALAACVAPHPTEEEYLLKTRAKLEEMVVRARQMDNEIDNLNRAIQAQGNQQQRRDAVQRYNANILEYNALIDEIRVYQTILSQTVKAFNTRIEAYNACLNAVQQ